MKNVGVIADDKDIMTKKSVEDYVQDNMPKTSTYFECEIANTQAGSMKSFVIPYSSTSKPKYMVREVRKLDASGVASTTAVTYDRLIWLDAATTYNMNGICNVSSEKGNVDFINISLRDNGDGTARWGISWGSSSTAYTVKIYLYY